MCGGDAVQGHFQKAVYFYTSPAKTGPPRQGRCEAPKNPAYVNLLLTRTTNSAQSWYKQPEHLQVHVYIGGCRNWY